VVAGARPEPSVELPEDSILLLERLTRWPFFRELDLKTCQEVAALMRLETHPPGELLLLDGDRCDALYIVARGYASHSHVSVEGREHVLGYIGPGHPLNLVAVVDGRPQCGSIYSLTGVTLYSLPVTPFGELLANRADLGAAVSRMLAREARQLAETARGLALDPVRKRLAAFLLQFAEQSPPYQRWTQDLIAAHIGSVRDVVGRVLRDMVREGILSRERGQLVILDRGRLEKEAGIGGE